MVTYQRFLKLLKVFPYQDLTNPTESDPNWIHFWNGPANHDSESLSILSGYVSGSIISQKFLSAKILHTRSAIANILVKPLTRIVIFSLTISISPPPRYEISSGKTTSEKKPSRNSDHLINYRQVLELFFCPNKLNE